jgi:hypothetical protein
LALDSEHGAKQSPTGDDCSCLNLDLVAGNAKSKEILTEAMAKTRASMARSRASMKLTRDAKLIIRHFKEVLSVIARFATTTQNRKVQKEISKFFEEIDKLPTFKGEVPSRKSLPRVATKKHR